MFRLVDVQFKVVSMHFVSSKCRKVINYVYFGRDSFINTTNLVSNHSMRKCCFSNSSKNSNSNILIHYENKERLIWVELFHIVSVLTIMFRFLTKAAIETILDFDVYRGKQYKMRFIVSKRHCVLRAVREEKVLDSTKTHPLTTHMG